MAAPSSGFPRATKAQLLAGDGGSAFEGRPTHVPAPPKIQAVVQAGEKAGLFSPKIQAAARLNGLVFASTGRICYAALRGAQPGAAQRRPVVCRPVRQTRGRERRAQRARATASSGDDGSGPSDSDGDSEPLAAGAAAKVNEIKARVVVADAGRAA
jgi:hypothetical protein